MTPMSAGAGGGDTNELEMALRCDPVCSCSLMIRNLQDNFDQFRILAAAAGEPELRVERQTAVN